MTLTELVLLCGYAAELQPRIVFEIGTFDGRTTLNLAANTASDGIVLTLDLPTEVIGDANLPRSDRAEHRPAEPSFLGNRISRSNLAPKIQQLLGDSRSFDFSPYAEKVDLFFIDGSHTKEATLSDSFNALACTHPGSLIVWHDFGAWPGTTSALEYLYRQDSRFANLVRIEGTALAILRV